MNTLTQQQINQYQWEAADGVARIVNPYKNIECHACEQNSDSMQSCTCTKFEAIDAINFHTNAPDGIYSGEAFELESQGLYESGWFKISELVYRNYTINPIDLLLQQARLYLRLKPSHLPAVLTTQPGEEWKDRYREVWLESFNGGLYRKGSPMRMRYFKDFDAFVKSLATAFKAKREWHLNAPPAEQEAETAEQAAGLAFFIDEEWAQIDKYVQYSKRHGFMRGTAWQLEQLQSTLTQKDQRIAELEREREWISIHDRLPEGQTEVLVYMPKYGSNINVYFLTDLDPNRKTWFNCFFDTKPFADVTHWMPIPTPPQH